jgi:membrane protein
MRHIHSWKSLAQTFAKGFSIHHLMTQSAALAFYTALSLAPLIVITLSVVGLLGQDSQKQLLAQISSLMGEQAATAITAIVNSAKERPELGSLAGVIGVIALLFSASGVFAQLQESLNIIFEAESKKKAGIWGWIQKRLLSMGMVLTLGFLSLVSLLASTVLSYFFGEAGDFWKALNFVVSLAAFAGLFTLILRYMPDRHLDWRNAFRGGVVTALLFSAGKSLIGLYLGQSAVGSAYGAAGSLMILLVWVYYSALIVFSGAELTKALSAQEEPGPVIAPV